MHKKCANFSSVEGRYVRLDTVEKFNHAVDQDGYIVILDDTNGDEVHLAACRFVTLTSFYEKVIENEGKTRCYFWCHDYDDALHTFGVRDCGVCMKS